MQTSVYFDVCIFHFFKTGSDLFILYKILVCVRLKQIDRKELISGPLGGYYDLYYEVTIRLLRLLYFSPAAHASSDNDQVYLTDHHR